MHRGRLSRTSIVFVGVVAFAPAFAADPVRPPSQNQSECEAVLPGLFAERELNTPFKSREDVRAAVDLVRKEILRREPLLEESKIAGLALRLLNASYRARRPVAPEFLLTFIHSSMAKFGRMSEPFPLNLEERIELLKFHLEADRLPTIRAARGTYFDYLTVAIEMGVRSGFEERLTALRIWRLGGLERRDIIFKGHHHPLGGVLLGSLNPPRILILFEALTRRLGRIPSLREFRQVKADAERAGELFGEFPTAWVERQADQQTVSSEQTVRRASFLSFYQSLRYPDRPTLSQEAARQMLAEKQQLVAELFPQIGIEGARRLVDLHRWDFGLR